MMLVERMKEFEANTRWIGDHYEELRQKYTDQWVAVHEGSVVAYGSELSSVIDILKNGFPEGHTHVAVEFISMKDVHLILGV